MTRECHKHRPLTNPWHPCADPEGGTGGPYAPPPHLENHKAIGFLSNTGPDALEMYKATMPTFNDDPL